MRFVQVSMIEFAIVKGVGKLVWMEHELSHLKQHKSQDRIYKHIHGLLWPFCVDPKIFVSLQAKYSPKKNDDRLHINLRIKTVLNTYSPALLNISEMPASWLSNPTCFHYFQLD